MDGAGGTRNCPGENTYNYPDGNIVSSTVRFNAVA